MEHSTETLAYAAGLFDGEGNIVINVTHPTERNQITAPHHQLFIRIKITDHPIVEWLKDNFGGLITDSSHQPSRVHNRPTWVWCAHGAGGGEFLSAAYPYLRIKQQQAAIALEFLAHKKRYPRWTHSPNRLSEEVLAQREAYRQQINSLHLSRKQWDSGGVVAASSYPISSSDSLEVRAYAAGLFDGEGCVHIRAFRPTEERGPGKLARSSYRLCVELANTDRPIIEWLHMTFGGVFQDRSSTPSVIANPKKRAVFLWYAIGDSGQKFLASLLPHLKIKSEQAQLAVAFQTINRPYASKAPELLAMKEDYWKRIRQLNQRRSHPVSPFSK